MAKRKPTQEAAEKAYRSKFAASVLVRLTKQEAKVIDAKRGDLTRPQYLKAKALEGAAHEAR